MDVLLVEVDDRPTIIRGFRERASDRDDISASHLSSSETSDIQIPLVTDSDIEFLIRFTFLVLFRQLPIDEFDVIHLRRIASAFPFYFMYRDIVIVTTCPGQLTNEMKLNKPQIFVTVYNVIEFVGIRASNTVIAISESSKSYLVEKHPTQQSKIVVVPIGVDNTIFKSKSVDSMTNRYNAENILVYAGRFSAVKNLPLLIDVFECLVDEEDWRLILAGKGEKEEEIRGRLAEKDLLQYAEFAGYVSQVKLSNIMNVSDCFVLTSSSEGGPHVIREALACGLPVVTTDVGDTKDVISNGKNGFVVSDAEARVLANRVKTVISQKDKFKEQAKNTPVNSTASFEEIMAIYKQTPMHKESE